MPPLEYADHYQHAVYWEAAGVDGYGQPTVCSPIELAVRWEPTHRLLVGKDGARIVAEVLMHTSRSIRNESVVWKGKLNDLPDDTDDISDLYEVILFEETPDLKNKHANRVALLRRFRDSLPTVV